MNRQKELKRQYAQEGPEAGIYKVECRKTGKVFLGSSTNAMGLLNSQRFQLQLKAHRNAELQKDWNEMGEESFIFEVIDVLEKKKEGTSDISADLKELEMLWQQKLNHQAIARY